MKTQILLPFALLIFLLSACNKEDDPKIWFEGSCETAYTVGKWSFCGGWVMKDPEGTQYRVFGLQDYEFEPGDIVYLDISVRQNPIDCTAELAPEDQGIISDVVCPEL